jgi:DNA-directed RNA polymerase sigma subunit (sigma70/sigma32)
LAAEHQAEANDPAALLPQLMEQLEPLEQRMIRNRYLRRPPLTPHQLRRSMGLEPDQMQALEQQAMAKLRKAAAKALRALD